MTSVPEACLAREPTCAPAEVGRTAAVTLARTAATVARTRILRRSRPGAEVKRPGLWTRLRNRVVTSMGPLFRAELRRPQIVAQEPHRLRGSHAPEGADQPDVIPAAARWPERSTTLPGVAYPLRATRARPDLAVGSEPAAAGLLARVTFDRQLHRTVVLIVHSGDGDPVCPASDSHRLHPPYWWRS